MSHSNLSISSVNAATVLPLQITIQNYTVGGEAVSIADVPGATSIGGVLMATIPSSKNSLAVVLFPLLDAGKIRLFRFTSGAPVEIATTVNLNAVITALVVASY